MVAGTLSKSSPIDSDHGHGQRHDSRIRLTLSQTIVELVLGSIVATVLTLALLSAVSRMSISEPSYAPEAIAMTGSAAILAIVFAVRVFGPGIRSARLRISAGWVSCTIFVVAALAIPLQGTRLYYGGSSVDNAFRMQYLTRMSESFSLADMNYAALPPYYPAGWFWLGGRFANVLGWEGWAAYKPYALVWVAVSAVVAFTLWSLLVRRSTALLIALATTMVAMSEGVLEPYALPSAAWLPPIAVLTWRALRTEDRFPRRTLVCVGAFVGFAAITYTLHFGFIVLLITAMAAVVGVLRVRAGASATGTARRMLTRLLPIGVIGLAISLVVWAPFLFSGGLFERSAAQHYLPEESAFLPLPMTDASALGVLCLTGLTWTLVRCRTNAIATASVATVVGIYCWFGLSTLALAARTTLLAFRLSVILEITLAAAGVIGLVELFGYVRRRFAQWHTVPIAALAGVLGLAGSVSMTQHAVGEELSSQMEAAYADFHPGASEPDGEQRAWYDDINAAIFEMTGRAPEQNIVLTADYKLLSFYPYWGFQQETPHYANPLADYEQRSAVIRRWSEAEDTRDLLRMLDRSRFRPPNVFVLRNHIDEGSEVQVSDAEASDVENPPAGSLAFPLKIDSFPQNPNVRTETVLFDAEVFDSPVFETRQVGPYTVITVR